MKKRRMLEEEKLKLCFEDVLSEKKT